jgi:hypothetical protein
VTSTSAACTMPWPVVAPRLRLVQQVAEHLVLTSSVIAAAIMMAASHDGRFSLRVHRHAPL